MTVYAADTSPLENPEIFDAVYRSVSAERRSKTDRLRFEKDKRLSLGVEYLLMCACRDYGVDYDEARVLRDENGRPCFAAVPLFFSLSHSENRVMCVMARDEVGCDVERIASADMELARTYFTESECRDLLACVNETTRSEQLFRIWTRKESVAKCSGKGLETPINEKDYIVFQQIPGDGYAYAWCIRKENAKKQVLDGTIQWIQIGLSD